MEPIPKLLAWSGFATKSRRQTFNIHPSIHPSIHTFAWSSYSILDTDAKQLTDRQTDAVIIVVSEAVEHAQWAPLVFYRLRQQGRLRLTIVFFFLSGLSWFLLWIFMMIGIFNPSPDTGPIHPSIQPASYITISRSI